MEPRDGTEVTGRGAVTKLNRRDLLRVGAGGVGTVVFGIASGCAANYVPPPNGTPFTLGVMSGLHDPDAVVLWTRLDPTQAAGTTTVSWQIATDPAMSTVIRRGSSSADPSRDHTVKVLVEGLEPDRSYWYRFDVDGVASRVGRARTLPSPGAAVRSLSVVVASCQNWANGWYHAWKGIAAEDVDAVLWLGDYIYESGTSVLSARVDSVGEATTLEQYRAKYRMYRSDPALQDGHAAHPFVPVRDDHELFNDCDRFSMLQFPERAAASYQAWFDYMPVMPIDGTRVYRSYRWGDLAVIPMLDSRQYRDRGANGFQGSTKPPIVGIGDVVREAQLPGRSMLGEEQRGWLLDTIDEAQAEGVRWKLLGNPVMMTPTRAIDLDEPGIRKLFPDLPRNEGLFINMDAWNSYLWERQLLFDHWHANSVDSIAVLTGDIHSFWRARQRLDMEDEASPVVATEYVTGSISSTTPNILRTPEFGRFLESGPVQWIPRFDYVDFRHNGYGVVRATPERLDVQFRRTLATERYASVTDGMSFSEYFSEY